MISRFDLPAATSRTFSTNLCSALTCVLLLCACGETASKEASENSYQYPSYSEVVERQKQDKREREDGKREAATRKCEDQFLTGTDPSMHEENLKQCLRNFGIVD